jgi:lycopene cyclase domain-containing protein
VNEIYFLLIVLTPLFPILLSFDKKVRYLKNWKWSLLAAVIIAIPFILWDEFFTQIMVWGFNDEYLLGVSIGSLPVEEICFFIVVPFACTFIYECVRYYFISRKLRWFNTFFYAALVLFAFLLALVNLGGWYTFTVVIAAVAVMLIAVSLKKRSTFLPLAFIISLIPFLIVNGILTGTGIQDEIVWYNEYEFSGLRIMTIPLEDILYSWSLISLNVMLYEFLKGMVREN